MKVQEILNEGAAGKSMEDLVARLEKVGGKVYTKIAKGDQQGWLGVNGKGKAKVYFAFYPDGTSQRFEALPSEKDLKSGWKADDLRDPETILADKSKADKLKKEREKEALYHEKIVSLSDAEFQKLNKEFHLGMDISRVVDFYPDGREAHGYKKVDGRLVPSVRLTVNLRNEDWRKGDDEKGNPHGPEIHDPVYVEVWRDPKNPEKLHAKDVTM